VSPDKNREKEVATSLRGVRYLKYSSHHQDYKEQRIDPKIKRFEAEGLFRKVRHLKDLKYPMNRLADYFGQMSAVSLTLAHVEQYKGFRLSQKTRHNKLVWPRGVNIDLNLLKTTLNWAVRVTKKLRENGIKGYEKLEEGEPKKIVFSVDEWTKFYEAVHSSKKDIFLAISETGARPAEILDLRWDWVNFFAGVIEIPASITKTRKGRAIPLSLALADALKALQ